MVRRRMLRTVIKRGHAEIEARHTRTEERKENRDLRGSGLQRAIIIISSFLPEEKRRVF